MSSARAISGSSQLGAASTAAVRLTAFLRRRRSATPIIQTSESGGGRYSRGSRLLGGYTGRCEEVRAERLQLGMGLAGPPCSLPQHLHRRHGKGGSATPRQACHDRDFRPPPATATRSAPWTLSTGADQPHRQGVT
ncbi:hypothetical protein GCM10023317_92670 [Actinopolymorpha pittospori]